MNVKMLVFKVISHLGNVSILITQILVIFGNIRGFFFTKIYHLVYGLLLIYFWNLELMLFINGWREFQIVGMISAFGQFYLFVGFLSSWKMGGLVASSTA